MTGTTPDSTRPGRSAAAGQAAAAGQNAPGALAAARSETAGSETAGQAAAGQGTAEEAAEGYPAGWEADVVVSDGGVVHLRPIRPEDADAIVAFHGKLTERTRYLR